MHPSLWMSKKIRADELMVSLQLVESRNKAQACILAGRVKWGDQKIQKSSQMLPADANLWGGGGGPYVGRGGLKMENFLREAKWGVMKSIFWI